MMALVTMEVPESDCGKWDMYGWVNGKMTVLTSSGCIAGGLTFRDDPGNTNWYALSPILFQLYSEIQVSRIVFNKYKLTKGPLAMTVIVAISDHFNISINGRENLRNLICNKYRESSNKTNIIAHSDVQRPDAI